MMNFTTYFKQKLLLIALLFFTFSSFSQKNDSTKNIVKFKGDVTVTNNGISLVPTFSLGKPATIFDFSISKNRLSFEPQLRFAIEGAKPWSFLFWVRYKLLQAEKFKFNVGIHPSFVFHTSTITANGVSKEVIITRRYWAGELSPNYVIAKNVSVGLYYLYARGLDPDAAKNSHFLALNSNFSNIKLPNRFFLKFAPQVFYLKIATQDGFYFTEALTLAKQNFPLSISSIATKTIQSNIASKDFVWNVSLIYSF